MARKKFNAEGPSSGQGLVSSSHTVRMRGGGTVKLEARPQSVRKGERDLEIADAKRRILNRLPIQEGKIRSLIKEGMARAEEVFFEADRGRNRSTGSLRPSEATRVAREVEAVVRSTVQGLRDVVLENMERSVKTYLIGVRRSLPDRDRLPMSVINDLARRKALEAYGRPTGASRVTTSQRIATLGGRMETELLKLVNVGMLERIKRQRALKRTLVDPKGSSRFCMAKGIARINRTEQNRAMQDATVEAALRAGVTLFYWRLSSAHKSYGGSEVCEVLSTSTGYDVESLIPQNFSGSLRGLYTQTSLPEMPHPNCMCSIEPFTT